MALHERLDSWERQNLGGYIDEKTRELLSIAHDALETIDDLTDRLQETYDEL